MSNLHAIHGSVLHFAPFCKVFSLCDTLTEFAKLFSSYTSLVPTTLPVSHTGHQFSWIKTTLNISKTLLHCRIKLFPQIKRFSVLLTGYTRLLNKALILCLLPWPYLTDCAQNSPCASSTLFVSQWQIFYIVGGGGWDVDHHRGRGGRSGRQKNRKNLQILDRQRWGWHLWY